MICANLNLNFKTGSAKACVLGRPMSKRRTWASVSAILLVAAILLLGRFAGAQETVKKEIFKARLSTVPIDVSMMVNVAGTGSLTATLSGKQLIIAGTFEGLRSPATTAQIHRGPKGIPGPAILDLTVTKAVKGEVTGSVDLTPDQTSDLRNERLYVQIQSERAPDGNLWGWILRQDSQVK